MKKSIISTEGYLAQTITAQPVYSFTRSTGTLFYCLAVLCAFLFAGCMKQDIKGLEDEALVAGNKPNTHGEFRTWYDGIEGATLWELQQARAATAKYRRIENAIRDGYEDINVILPNMGYHYMNMDYVDATIEIRKPEILVYNKDEDGNFELVAVEYAVPLTLRDTAPEGFTGTSDVWNRHTGFGLWLLHAWVWYNNPAGVFNPTNPLVHVVH